MPHYDTFKKSTQKALIPYLVHIGLLWGVTVPGLPLGDSLLADMFSLTDIEM